MERTMTHVSTDFSPSTVSARLDDGAWVLAQNRRARGKTAKLAQEARALIVTFRSHRFRPISGADDPADDGERIRRELRAFASFGRPRTFVGQSRGSNCDACGRKIFIGEMEYDLVASNGKEIRLNSDCYLLLINELAAFEQTPNAAAS
jgi:hypothetical protein